ncbi:hypothetical protein CLV40_1241 [Actinokineospora auranticolor]|uniref:Uncharacterized protein n=1 Tax=Actinokineospora auranticolor TaxID=155976 RepID=A0A2S6GF33_9PSEU|nr:hypothetical protein CLV40_1241 [Actinokineospora auranticolor]
MSFSYYLYISDSKVDMLLSQVSLRCFEVSGQWTK